MPQCIGEALRRRLTPQPPVPLWVLLRSARRSRGGRALNALRDYGVSRSVGAAGPHSVVGSPRRSARLCLRRTAYDWGPGGSQRWRPALLQRPSSVVSPKSRCYDRHFVPLSRGWRCLCSSRHQPLGSRTDASSPGEPSVELGTARGARDEASTRPRRGGSCNPSTAS